MVSYAHILQLRLSGRVVLIASTNKFTDDEKVELSLTLTNAGKHAGEEVAQLYIQDLVASVVRPVKELKDFRKVMLKPGESKVLSFTIDREKLSFYNKQLDWIAEPGEFKIMVGTSSDDIKLETTIELLTSDKKKARLDKR